jgi:hypothetical protein
MGRIGRKQKAGTGSNKRVRIGSAGLGTCYGRGSQVLTDGTPVPVEDVVNTLSSTDSTVSRTLEISKNTTYLAPFKTSLFVANPSSNPIVSATLEMQLVEYCRFLSGMAKHGTTSTSKSKLPNLVVKIREDNKVEVTLELSDASDLVELQRTSVTVSLNWVLIKY